MALNLWWRSFCINRNILREHRKRPFDVIHFAHLGGLGMLCPRILPSVARLSSSTRLCQEFGGYGGSDLQIRQQEWIERIALRKADQVFGPSERISRLTTEETGVDVRVIESPFLKDFKVLDESLYVDHLHNKTYLLFFGSIGRIKGVGTIAGVIHRVLSTNPDLHFVFVGKRVPGQDGGDLMDLVWRESKEHRDRVLWFPAQPHSKLYPIIQHARGVVLPSRIDNFPNACIEAMAYGRIVIGTVGNGFEQLITHGKSGFLCAVDDSEGLLRAIEDLLALPIADQRHMGEHALRRIEELRPEKTVVKVIDCYLDAIESHGKVAGRMG